MRNYIQPGNVLTLISPLDLGSGDPVLVGKFFGVCNYDAAAGLPVEVSVTGVFSLPKTTGVTFAVGDAVYWNPGAGSVTSVSSGTKLIGAATEAAGSGATTVAVRLNGVSVPPAGT